MHICHIYKDFFPPTIGGIEKFICLVTKYQKQDAQITVLVCSKQFSTCRENIDGIQIIRVSELGRILSTPISPLFPYYLGQIKADIFVVHSPNPLAETSVLFKSTTPYIVRYHSDVVRQKITMKLYTPIFNRYLGKAKVIIPTSRIYAETSPYLRKFSKKCLPIPLGIEVERFEKENNKKIRSLKDYYGENFVFFCGVHRYYKGLHVLLDSARFLDIPIVIGGDGPERRKLEIRARKNKLKNVFFIGELTDDELVDYLHACSIFVFPSVARSEAFGLSIIEAHSAGKPVVATKLGTGVEYANLDGITGLNVPPNDAKKLADAINFLIDNPKIREEMGKQAKDRVKKEMDIRIVAEKELEIYRSVLSQ